MVFLRSPEYVGRCALAPNGHLDPLLTKQAERRPELYNRRTLVLESNADAPMQTETRVMIYPRREGPT